MTLTHHGEQHSQVPFENFSLQILFLCHKSKCILRNNFSKSVEKFSSCIWTNRGKQKNEIVGRSKIKSIWSLKLRGLNMHKNIWRSDVKFTEYCTMEIYLLALSDGPPIISIKKERLWKTNRPKRFTYCLQDSIGNCHVNTTD